MLKRNTYYHVSAAYVWMWRIIRRAGYTLLISDCSCHGHVQKLLYGLLYVIDGARYVTVPDIHMISAHMLFIHLNTAELLEGLI